MKNLTTFLILLYCYTPSLFSQPVLVLDIAPGNTNAFPTNASNMVSFGENLIFTASTNDYGLELYISDGSASGTKLLKDINPGSSNSGIRKLYAAKNYVYFFANDGVHGKEVWRTDGTTEGTVMIKDIIPGSSDGIYESFDKIAEVSDSAFYFISSPANRGLYMTNGTEDNVFLIKHTDDLKDVLGTNGGNLYFTEYYSGGNYVASLWKTGLNGTGTTKLKESNVSFTGIHDFFATIGDEILYVMSTPGEGTEIWKSNGTPAGTSLLKDIVPGNGSSVSVTWSTFYKWKNEVYFNVFPGSAGQELWKTNGSDTGTVKVTSLPDRPTNLPSGAGRLNMAGLNDKLIFTIYSQTSGRDIWVTDGSELGTQLLMDQSNSSFYAPTGFINYKDKLYISASSVANGKELYSTDGTLSGTVQISDLNPGSNSSTPERLTVSNNKLFFDAYTSSKGYELYKYYPPISVSYTSNNPMCFGDSSGYIILDINTEGTPPFTANWEPSWVSGLAPTNLPSGSYSVTVTDANGATDTESVNLTQPALLNINIVATPEFDTLNNGTAIANVSGGTPPYSYLWNTDPIQFTKSITNLSFGDYSCIVTDANGCTITAQTTVGLISETTEKPEINLQVKLAPNPVDGTLNWSVHGGQYKSGFIISSAGQIIKQLDENELNHGQSNVNSLVPGTYYLILESPKGGNSFTKFILLH